jgi:HK97 family phage major capsid protein
MDSSEDRLRGKAVVFDETLPQLAADAPVMIYGDLSRAFAMANGDIDYMQINTMKKQGVRYVENNKEMFTIIQASDAIVIVVATTNSGEA